VTVVFVNVTDMSNFQTPEYFEERISQLITQLHEQLRDNAKCRHVTIRAPYLPCPHPDCYALPDENSPYLRCAVMPELKDIRFSEVDNSALSNTKTETWKRVSVLTNWGDSAWGWQKVC
jgi:hypothetical protein